MCVTAANGLHPSTIAILPLRHPSDFRIDAIRIGSDIWGLQPDQTKTHPPRNNFDGPHPQNKAYYVFPPFHVLRVCPESRVYSY
ncbi:hypothetical protein MTP99_019466 [Tenebrio molitor]|nr:hypothetical protein MTP99_019466 [Tenebrio molitor]